MRRRNPLVLVITFVALGACSPDDVLKPTAVAPTVSSDRAECVGS